MSNQAQINHINALISMSCRVLERELNTAWLISSGRVNILFTKRNDLLLKLFSTFHLLENLDLCGCNGLPNKQHSFKPFFPLSFCLAKSHSQKSEPSCHHVSNFHIFTITYFHIVFNIFPSTIEISLLQYTKLLDVFESVNSFCLYHGLIPVTEKIAVPYSL